MTPLLMVRRARRDLAVLVVWMALVAFAVALAVGQPRLLQGTVDAGARQAVATAGANSDVFVTASVSSHADSIVPPLSPSDIESLASGVPHRLPIGLRTVYGGSTLSVLGPATRLSAIDGSAPIGSSPIAVQVAMLTPQNSSALRLSQGALPAASGDAGAVDVVLSAAAARVSGLSVGSIAQVSTIPVASSISGGDHLTMRVVGIVGEEPGAAAAQWTDVPNLWVPTVPTSASSPVQITVLTGQSGVTSAASQYANPFRVTDRIRLDSQKFTAALEGTVSGELVALAGHSEKLAGNTGAQLGVTSSFSVALADFPARERATVAQISLVAAGTLGVAAAVLLLVSRMLVLRRKADLALERARGASLASIFVRALLETVIAGAIGALIGLAIIQFALPGPFVGPSLLAFVLVVAVLAVPLQTVLLVRGTWTGRKVPANREDRVDLARRARVRRIAVELTIVALAIAAFVSLATRGLLETQTNGVDLLLASTPLLLAASITIVTLRIYRFPLMIGIAAGRRSTGALGLLAAVRAQRSIAVLPLLSLTLAVALAVGGGLLASTVSAGQETASWQRIGADVRAHATATPAQVSAVEASPGVTAATAIRSENGIQFRLTGGTNFGTLVAVNPGFAGFVQQLPAGGGSASAVAALRALSTSAPATATAALPVVVNRDFADQISSSNVGMYVGTTFIPIHVVGVTDFSPSGYLSAPFVFVDRAALAARLSRTVATNILLVNGPGASSAVTALGVGKSAVQTRAHWLSTRRHLALVSGVNQAISLATTATALLAVLALIVTVLSGARERGRSLALIRTLGLPARLGWWLALAELAPVLVAALVGGVVAGVGIVLLLEPAMGLRELAGGLGNPAPTLSLALIVGLVGAAIGLLLLAVLIEVAVRRRDRLSEVLRVGEST
jgi:putative ABC transport system permease protein